MENPKDKLFEKAQRNVYKKHKELLSELISNEYFRLVNEKLDMDYNRIMKKTKAKDDKTKPKKR